MPPPKQRRQNKHAGNIDLYLIFMSTVTVASFLLLIVNVMFHKKTADVVSQRDMFFSYPGMTSPEVGESGSRTRYRTDGTSKKRMSNKTGGSRLDRILSGNVNMIGLKVGRHALEGTGNKDDEKVSHYKNVIGSFCELDWSLHKSDPASVPMFKDLIHKSPNCKNSSFELPLDSVIKALNSQKNPTTTHIIPPTGFVFHESRCGSTLVANTLSAASPSRHRVYSESAPLIEALRACGDGGTRWRDGACHRAAHLSLVKDVVTIMGLTNDEESRLFFKVQSIGTKSIAVMRAAFPRVPWVFVYRDPVQVMMSHLKTKEQRSAVCLRYRSRPQEDLKMLVKEAGRDVASLSTEEHCAAHLASLCQAALTNHKSSTTGIMLNYVDIPQKLLSTVFPDHFHIPIGKDATERVNAVCGKYSKGRGVKGEWVHDSDAKENRAWDEVRAASELFLKDVTDSLMGDTGGAVKR